MRMITMILVLAWLCTPLAAQDSRPAASLAKAMRLEERTELDQALKLFEDVVSQSPPKSHMLWEGQLGRVRCLIKMKNWKDARALLGSLKTAECPVDLVSDVNSLFQELATKDPQAFEKRLYHYLQKNDLQAVVDMGARARPILLRTVGRKALGNRATRALFKMGGPNLAQDMLSLARRLGAEDFKVVLGEIQSLKILEPLETWRQVISVGLSHEDWQVRRAALFDLSALPDLGGEAIIKMSQDRYHVVRSDALTMFFRQAKELPEGLVRRFFDVVSRSPHSQSRSALINHMRLLDALDRDLARQLIRRFLEDPDLSQVRLPAMFHVSRSFSREEARSILLAGLNSPSKAIIEVCLKQLVQCALPADISRILPLLPDSEPKVASAAAAVLKQFTAAQIVSTERGEDLLGSALAEGRDMNARRLAAAKLAIAGSPRHAGVFRGLLGSSLFQQALYFFIRQDDVEAVPDIMAHWSQAWPADLSGASADARAGVANVKQFGMGHLLKFLQRHHRANDLGRIFLKMDAFPGDDKLFLKLLEAMSASQDTWSQDFILSGLEGAHLDRRRTMALEYFGSILQETPRFREFLLDSIASAGGSDLAQASAKVLASWKGPLDPARLARLLESSNRRTTLDFLLSALQNQRPDEVARLVEEKAPRAEGTELRALLMILEKVRNRAAIKSLLMRTDLKEGLGEKARALELAAETFGPEVIAPLLDSLEKSPDLYSRQPFRLMPAQKGTLVPLQLELIFNMGPATFLPVMNDMLASSRWTPGIKAHLIQLAAYTEEDVGGPIIIAALQHAEGAVRSRAALAAGHLLMVEAVPLLKKLLRDPQASVSASQALTRLAEMGLKVIGP